MIHLSLSLPIWTKSCRVLSIKKKIARETWGDLIIFLFPFLSILCTDFSCPFSISSHFTYSRNLILLSLPPPHLLSSIPQLFLLSLSHFLLCPLPVLSCPENLSVCDLFVCDLTSLVVPVIFLSGNTLSWKYNCLSFKPSSSAPVLKLPIPHQL